MSSVKFAAKHIQTALTQEQNIICGQLFAGGVAGSLPMNCISKMAADDKQFKSSSVI